MDETLKLSLFC